MHTRNIYKEDELTEAVTCKQSLQVQIEGNRSVKRTVKFYNLDMILATYAGASVRQGDVTIAKKYLKQKNHFRHFQKCENEECVNTIDML